MGALAFGCATDLTLSEPQSALRGERQTGFVWRTQDFAETETNITQFYVFYFKVVATKFASYNIQSRGYNI